MSFFNVQVQPADVDRIAVAVALTLILMLAVFTLGLSIGRLADAKRRSLPNSMEPIGFVHF
jgi:hypothetical protein